MARWAIERSLLPLLDVSIMLVGLFLILMAAQHQKAQKDASVFAGQSIILVEVVFENDSFLAYGVDQDSGHRVGGGLPLAECRHLIDDQLISGGREGQQRVTVLVQMPALRPEVVQAWTSESSRTLADALAEMRWTMVWGD